MAESSTNPENGLFNIRSTPSNEHLVFAESLRDWRDPLLQGYQPISVPLCPRCATCRCESLKAFPNSSSHHDHHHHKHDPSCPNFRHQHEQTKTFNKQSFPTKRRRTTSHDPSIKVINTSKPIEQSPLTHAMNEKHFISKIPVKMTGDFSFSSSSIIKNQASNKKTKIPRLVSTYHSPSPTKLTDDPSEIDSLNDDIHQDNGNISSVKNQLDNMDKQILMKKKRRYKHSSSTSDKRQRRYRHKEGHHSQSRSSPNDLSSSNSSTSSSQSIIPLRKKSSSYRVSSPSQVPSSLSEQKQSRPHSTFVSTNDQSNHSSLSPSLYLIQLTNKTNSINSFGLTKTITYVWKSTHSKLDNEEINSYPRYSIEQVQPIINKNKQSIPISSRNITLQCGQIDYWQNFQTLPDSFITSSCINSTGSAFQLLSPSLEIKQLKTPTNSNGHIISITTTKRSQPSLLNKTKNIQWNIEGNGKQFRYSMVKSYSDNQLHKHKHLTRKYRTKYVTDSSTDSGSSSEQKNRSAPPILQHEKDTNASDQIYEGITFDNEQCLKKFLGRLK